MPFMIKRLCLAVLLLAVVPLVLSGCATAIAQHTGKIPTNPLVEVEIDLVFIEELSAMIKLNETILERIPISLEDRWPEMLNHYNKEVPDKYKAAKNNYDKCLTNRLKDDFTFFKLYNPVLYISYLANKTDILSGVLMGGRATMFIEAAKGMGRDYEHAKSVLGYTPFGCSCPYYSPEVESYKPGSQACLSAARKGQCEYFDSPTEDLLFKYAFGSGMNSWVEMKIDDSCFRVVEGTRVGATFKEAFYTLLPASSRDKMKKLDEEIADTEADLSVTKGELERKDINPAEKASLRKKQEQLSAELENKKKLQEKLYQSAMTTIEGVTPEKVQAAKKLLLVADFIDSNFAEIASAMAALTGKIVDDVAIWGYVKPKDWGEMLSSMVVMGVIVGPDAKTAVNKRFEMMGKRLLTLPVNYFSVWGYAIAQKSQVEKYKNYLNAVVAQERKIKKV
jgi:hypothetical protein